MRFTVARLDARIATRTGCRTGLRMEGVDAGVEDLVDAALDTARLTVLPIQLPGWDATLAAVEAMILGELWRTHHTLLTQTGVGGFVNERLRTGQAVSADRLSAALAVRTYWQADVAAALAEVEVLALPPLIGPPPLSTDFADFRLDLDVGLCSGRDLRLKHFSARPVRTHLPR